MARIAGVDIPNEKAIKISLTYIYGIGRVRALETLEQAKISPDKKTKDLNEDEISKIQKLFDKNRKIEGDLRREVRDNIRRYSDIRCVRGLRHEKKLPVRGQRTRHNARTKRGKKQTVGGMKRKLEKT